MQCARCKARTYCGTICQASDWPTHKKVCGNMGSPGVKWYDKYRKCQDGNKHEGDLELITWVCAKDGTGWGNCAMEESADLKRKFEDRYGGDQVKLYKYWPQAFRWTCCGTDADLKYGCDHHGSGSVPCTCDFCRMGKALPNGVYNEQSASRMGLQLRRGPDPRSFNGAIAGISATMRTMLGLEM